MISNVSKKYCTDIKLVENYQEAVSDLDHIWHCHHKKEITEGKNMEQLINEDLYYNRPPEELIFLTRTDHLRLHGLNQSLDTLKKISDNLKGSRNGMYGKQRTNDFKKLMSERMRCSQNPSYKSNGTT